MTQESLAFTDETLSAYLDGELDAATTAAIDAAIETDETLVDRLAALDIPVDLIRSVMAPDVLGAPPLPDFLREAEEPIQSQTPTRTRPRSFLPLALVASFLVGMVATTLILPEPEPAPGGWTAAVASYQALYVTETLATSKQDAAARDAVLARAGLEFDVTLASATQIDGLDFKRAQMLGFKGKPLLQMAYLTPDGTPMALCLIRTDNPDRGFKEIDMFDLAGTSWVSNGVGYLLIGGDDASQIEALSNRMIAAL